VYPANWPSWVRIRLHDGQALEERVEHPCGDPENFLPDAELEAKFRRLATRSLSSAAIDRLVIALAELPAAPRVAPLLAALVPPGR
jgi:2-methylcitrate dehydratase PrpD